jgi:hypothetical protein
VTDDVICKSREEMMERDAGRDGSRCPVVVKSEAVFSPYEVREDRSLKCRENETLIIK